MALRLGCLSVKHMVLRAYAIIQFITDIFQYDTDILQYPWCIWILVKVLFAVGSVCIQEQQTVCLAFGRMLFVPFCFNSC